MTKLTPKTQMDLNPNSLIKQRINVSEAELERMIDDGSIASQHTLVQALAEQFKARHPEKYTP